MLCRRTSLTMSLLYNFAKLALAPPVIGSSASLIVLSPSIVLPLVCDSVTL